MAKAKDENFQVSATGGAGTNGQPARYAAGIDNAQDFYDMQTSAPMSGQNPALRQSPSGNRAFRTTGQTVQEKYIFLLYSSPYGLPKDIDRYTTRSFCAS